MTRETKRAQGATPVEVVVVIATAGLLVSLFVPLAARGREPSRMATCLANLRLISQAAAGYATENGSIVFAFPFGYKAGDYQPDFNVATEFIWGGGVPDKRAIDWNESQGYFNPGLVRVDTYCIVPADRPLNEYMVPGVWWSHPLRYRGRSERWQIPMELPDFFKCPSDSTAFLPEAGVTDPNIPGPGETWYPSWEWWGTSYAANWYWAYYFGQDPGHPSFLDVLMSGAYGQALLEEKANGGASEFILFYENRLNFAFESARPRGYNPGQPQPQSLQGWHGHQNAHAAGFADGSARYQTFDTRYTDGPGWTLWPNRPWSDYWAPYQDN